MNKNALSELVAQVRALDMSQKEIAEATKIPQGTISRVLSGKHVDPRYSTVAALMDLVEKRAKAA